MRAQLLSITMAFAIAISTFAIPQRSEAAVGLIIKSKKTLVMSGISAGLSGVGAIVASTTATSSAGGGVLYISSAAILGSVGFAIFGALGIILLDDNTVAELSYRQINLENPKDYQGFTRQEVAIYNSEVEELNSIKKSMEAELTEDATTQDSAKLWNLYKAFVSPETAKIAQAKAHELTSNLKR